MKKHTRATPANVPRSRSKWTRRTRKKRLRILHFLKGQFEKYLDVVVERHYASERPRVLE